MLCECVPVITNRGAIPELVGNTGFYVKYNNPEMTAQMIKKALHSDKGKDARNRIAKKFTLQKRGELIKNEIEKLIRGSIIFKL